MECAFPGSSYDIARKLLRVPCQKPVEIASTMYKRTIKSEYKFRIRDIYLLWHPNLNIIKVKTQGRTKTTRTEGSIGAPMS